MQVRAPIRAGNARVVSPCVVGVALLRSHVRGDPAGGPCTGSGIEDGVGIWSAGLGRAVVALRDISITGKTWCE